MDPISQIVARNVKAFRAERRLSLQELSDICGVSKSMLGEIERGASNPTIHVLWKIAAGLKVPFTRLTTALSPAVQLVRAEERQGFLQGDRYTCNTVFQYDPNTRTEIYFESFEAGGRLDSEGHPGVWETLLVQSGTLSLQVAGESYALKAGDAIRFDASEPHSYAGEGPDGCQVQMILHYEG